MDSPRPILPTELEFFNKGTGRGKFPPNLLSANLQCTDLKYFLYSSSGGCIH